MYARFRELMTQGYALSNKFHFGEWNQRQFNRWIDDCKSLLSCCEPEPYFTCFPTADHIEEIVMLLSEACSKISRGEIEYMGIS